jgi:thimet oligopeptidase
MLRTLYGLAAATSLVALSSSVAAVPARDAVSRETDRFLDRTHLLPANAAEFTAACDAYLARAAAVRGQIERETGRAGIETTFRKFDSLTAILDAASSDAGVVANTNNVSDIRDAARACNQRVSSFETEVSLSRPIYDRLKAIDASRADPVVRHLLTRTIAAYERGGVAAEASVRAQITTLQERISQNSIAFARNIAEGRKEVFATPAEMAGLPADYLAAHQPDAQGRIRITTDTPDLAPVLAYATDEGLRRRLMEANLTRAYPANNDLLRQIFSDRAELARLLGRPNFATLVTEDKMIGSPANAQRFLDELKAAADAPARRDHQAMLARLRQIDPNASAVPLWSATHFQQLIRKEQYDVDPQEVRRYFAYNNVRDGIFGLTQDLFGVEIRRWNTPVWADGVEAFEMYDRGQLIGRFYLDNHPRPGKYTHAAVNWIRSGITGRRVPTALLIANFPRGDHSTGLMEHRDVETFLHEFGHLIHVLFSGRQDWHLANMGNLEWDVIEAPSTMLENWVWDYETLRRFAKDANGQVIPRDLVERMNRARGFAEAFQDRRQLGLSAASLAYHLNPPGDADLSRIYRTANDSYALVPMPEGLHPQASFGHLTGYSAIYYTYMWSKTVATDLFTRFEANGLRDPATARRYRELVLAPGSSKPAATLIRDFLGRPNNLDAYRARMNRTL